MKLSRVVCGLTVVSLFFGFFLTNAHAMVEFTGCLRTSAPIVGSQINVRVNAGSDDAEEASSGSVGLTSSDLEITEESSQQEVGMRFNNLLIPPGATITRAYVQFQVDETDSGGTNFTIEGEKIPNAPTFINSNGNITLRDRTTASVGWSPVDWPTKGLADLDQRTEDITAIIQEIIDQGLWASGNSAVIIITGNGKRVAESFNGDSSGAPLLHVEFDSAGGNIGSISRIAIGATPTQACTANETQITWNANGPAGVDGLDGLDGLDGPAGADGTNGTNGTDGIDGIGLNIFDTGNTAGGENALTANTSGTGNTAFGFDALTANTTGFQNTATGRRALEANTTGNNNTATGSTALFSNTTGSSNTATGRIALSSNTTGQSNTATGESALIFNTGGNDNTATGRIALFSNTTGSNNTATGSTALKNNTTGFFNTAEGESALLFNTTGNNNTATGRRALFSNTTGSSNTAVGFTAGGNLTGGNNNLYLDSLGPAALGAESNTIRIGDVQTRAFIEGISGVNVAGAAVIVNASGQLGVTVSSARYKEDIRDLGEVSNRLLSLRPVQFRYKSDVQKGERPVQYGLIAEEVAKVFPELVIYNEDGQPETVAYHILSTLLLNELQENRARLVASENERRENRTRLIALEGMVQRLTAPGHQRASFVPSQ